MAAIGERIGPLGISNMVDVRSRRLAGGRTLANLLARERVPPNSDYFPYVDLEAPRARFKRETAAGILNLGVAPLPVVEIIERWAPDAGERASQTPNPNLERQRLARQADDLMAFLSDLKPADSRLVPSNLDASLVSAFRLTLLDCTEPAQYSRPLGSGSAAWRPLRGGWWCRYRRTFLAQRRSFAVPQQPPALLFGLDFAASQRQRSRSARDRTNRGVVVGIPDKTTHQIEYLVLASVTGALAQGKTQEAKSTLTAALPALSPQSRELAWFALVATSRRHLDRARALSKNKKKAPPKRGRLLRWRDRNQPFPSSCTD
jgi:hypothetical protein